MRWIIVICIFMTLLKRKQTLYHFLVFTDLSESWVIDCCYDFSNWFQADKCLSFYCSHLGNFLPDPAKQFWVFLVKVYAIEVVHLEEIVFEEEWGAFVYEWTLLGSLETVCWLFCLIWKHIWYLFVWGIGETESNLRFVLVDCYSGVGWFMTNCFFIDDGFSCSIFIFVLKVWEISVSLSTVHSMMLGTSECWYFTCAFVYWWWTHFFVFVFDSHCVGWYLWLI
jgi:hypothetical protein